MNPSMQECIDTCLHCHRVCLEALTQHCLRMGGEHVEQQHVKLMLDCIQICQTSADFMIRGSERHQLTCGICAEICRQCAASCSRLEGDAMRYCATTCTQCSDTCRAMSAQPMRDMATV